MAGGVNKVICSATSVATPRSDIPRTAARSSIWVIATSERWRDRSSGENRERTEWHRVVIFNDRLGEVAEKYLSKGRSVYLEGQLQTRKWQDQSGQRSATPRRWCCNASAASWCSPRRPRRRRIAARGA